MDVREIAVDAAYVAVGFGVLGVQRANVARREFVADVERRIGSPLTLPAIAALFARPN